MSYWTALVLAVFANIGANLAFKHFVHTTEFTWTLSSFGSALLKPTFWIGVGLGVSLLVGYLYALRGLPISVAYTAATTLSIAGITCVGVLIYGEAFVPRMAVGLGMVLAGVFLISSA